MERQGPFQFQKYFEEGIIANITPIFGSALFFDPWLSFFIFSGTILFLNDTRLSPDGFLEKKKKLKNYRNDKIIIKWL